MPEVTLEYRADDPQWDSFVAAVPGGHHLQTTMWARVKAVSGLRAARVVARRDGEIVAGCQVLIRTVRGLGAVAYAGRGPLMGDPEPALLDSVLDGLDELAARRRVGLLKLQPPAGHHDMKAALAARGYQPSHLQAGPVATVRVPLAHDSEKDLLASLRSNTRRDIRAGLRRGLEVRAGEETDVATLQRLLEDTGRRQGFAVYPEAHHRCLWHTFSPEHAVLLLAEREGTPVAANLLVGFGDSAVFKVGAWDGSEAAGHPNELLHWHGMRWARERGHAFYDLEGISLQAARALRAGESLPEDTSGITRFKARFAGEVVVLPETHDLTYPTLLGRALRRLAPAVQRWHGLAHRAVGRRA